ncbi:MAG: glycerol-3-phosphate dehydrogenase [Pelagibacterales bacterium]|nr:glycerol-3-phosphate dehydrogenase [Pelagibacterales bacterium]
MAKILILGAGAMGSAFSNPCIDRNHNVAIIGTHLEDQLIEKINQNKKFHPALKFKISNKVRILKFSSFFDEAYNSDIIIIGVNSRGINWVSDQINILGNYNKEIILLTKGLHLSEEGKLEILITKLKKIILSKKISVSGIAGPCLASGLANRVNSSVVIVNENLSKAKKLAKMFKTKYYHTNFSSDVIGVEASAALKNIYSMIIGAGKYLSVKKELKLDNSKIFFNPPGALISQCLKEMIYVVEKLGGKKETVYDLAGLGDLYVSSLGGRNALMGNYLGQSYTFIEAKRKFMKNDTIEAADLIFDIGKKILKIFPNSKLPLMVSLTKSLLLNKKFTINWSKINNG